MEPKLAFQNIVRNRNGTMLKFGRGVRGGACHEVVRVPPVVAFNLWNDTMFNQQNYALGAALLLTADEFSYIAEFDPQNPNGLRLQRIREIETRHQKFTPTDLSVRGAGNLIRVLPSEVGRQLVAREYSKDYGKVFIRSPLSRIPTDELERGCTAYLKRLEQRARQNGTTPKSRRLQSPLQEALSFKVPKAA